MSSIYCQPCEERRWDKRIPKQRCTAPTCPNFKFRDEYRHRALKGIAGGRLGRRVEL